MGFERHSCSTALGRGPAVFWAWLSMRVVLVSLPSDPAGQILCRDLCDLCSCKRSSFCAGLEVSDEDRSVRFYDVEGIHKDCCGWCAVFAIMRSSVVYRRAIGDLHLFVGLSLWPYVFMISPRVLDGLHPRGLQAIRLLRSSLSRGFLDTYEALSAPLSRIAARLAVAGGLLAKVKLVGRLGVD